MHRLVCHIRRSSTGLTLDRPGIGAFRQARVDRDPAGVGNGAASRGGVGAERPRGEGSHSLPARRRAQRSRCDEPAAWVIRRMTRARTTQYIHADETRWRPKLTSFAVQRSNAVIGVSRHTCRLALEAGADPARLHRIPNGVDLPERGRQACSAADRPHGRPARGSYKGHDVLHQGAAADPRPVSATSAGSSWATAASPRARVAARSTVVATRCTSPATVSDAERDAWLAAAHVFAMPSRLPAVGVAGRGVRDRLPRGGRARAARRRRQRRRSARRGRRRRDRPPRRPRRSRRGCRRRERAAARPGTGRRAGQSRSRTRAGVCVAGNRRACRAAASRRRAQVKVLYLNHTSQMSGGERSLFTLLAALPDDVAPAVACPDGPMAGAVRDLGIPFARIARTDGSLRLHPWHTPRGVFDLGRAARTVRRLARGSAPT